MFVATVITRTKMWEQPNYLSTEDMCYDMDTFLKYYAK